MKKRLILIAVATLLPWLPGLAGANPPAATVMQETTPSETQDEKKQEEPPADPVLTEFQSIEAEFQQAMADWQQRVRASNVKTREEAEPFIKERKEFVAKSTSKFLEFTQKYPRHEKAFDCYLFVAQNSEDASVKKVALQKLIADHTNHANFSQVLLALAFDMPSQENLDGLQAIFERAEDPQVKGLAQFYLGKSMFDAKSNADAYLNDESIKSQLDPASIAFLEKAKEFEEADYLEILRKAASDFPDVDVMGQKLRVVTEKLLYEIEFLSVGKVAPEIEGEDLDGEAFKLSDYRGKVVMLDFWGDW